MPIKHAEITVVFEDNMMNSVNRLLGLENALAENDRIIISFDDDGYVCDTKDKCIIKLLLDDDGFVCDKKKEGAAKIFKIGPPGFQKIFPVYFNIGDHLLIKNKISNNKVLDYKRLFKHNIKSTTTVKVPSIYNVIYHAILNIDVFAIVKIKSNEKTPRYLLAYDDVYFERADVIYFVNCMFKHLFD